MSLPLAKHRLTRALLRQPIDCTPIWVMRQAGRYLPEFKALRQKQPNFMSFCKEPEWVVAATLQPLARFDLDAAIIFSDILVIPEAMGLELAIHSGIGPVITNPIRTTQDVRRLIMPDVNEALNYVIDSISQVVKELNDRVPLIGFAGSPWTCAAYMVEGKSSKNFDKLRSLVYTAPNLLHELLEKIARLTTVYLQAQVNAGAQVLMLFDTWGGLLSHLTYQPFSLNYMQQIAKNLNLQTANGQVPLIFFTKGGGQWLTQIASSGCDAVGLDWTTDLAYAEQMVGDQVALQGNLDPTVLLASPARISQEVQTILNSFTADTGHVFNLGHGILPETPVENMQALVEAVHHFGKKGSK